MPHKPNYYTTHRLDRAADRRKDREWLAARLAAPGTRVVPVWRTRNLVVGQREDGYEGGHEAPRAVMLDPAELATHAEAPVALLGLLDGVAYFAADLSALDAPEDHPQFRGRGSFVDLRAVSGVLPADEAGLCAYARGLMWWHARHRFCGVCGSPTESREAGHVRQCLNLECAAPHFPRTDPAVIMLVHDGDRCLLGRTPRFPPGNYSTLAGFVEPGESVEDAVAREVFEETGVRVADVRYHSSQPWPFPASIMLGFHARALTTDIRLQPDEMEDARWFGRDWLRAVEAGAPPDDVLPGFRLSRADTIARRLIEDWLAGRA